MRLVARSGAILGASIAALAGADVGAQAIASADTNGRGFSVVPGFAISETLTNNSQLTSTNRQSDAVTQVTPSIRVTSTGGRVRGFVDYSLNGLLYARSSAANELQNSLNSVVNIEAIENWAFIDASAIISQQYTSAYGTQSVDSTLINNNRTEVRTFTVSPFVKGRLASAVDYEARLTQSWTRNSTSEEANYNNSSAELRFDSDRGLNLVNWSAGASAQVYDYTVGRRTEDDRIRAALHFTVNPQLRLTLSGGVESSNISSIDKQTESTPGAGIEWTPTERTKLLAQYEKRFFGNSHLLSFEHRTPRTVWRYSDTEDIQTGFGQPAAGQLGTAYDLLFTQFASVQPDPTLRATLVDQFLRANGIAPTAQVFSGSLASAATSQRRQDLSVGYVGIRDTVTVTGSQTRGVRVDPVSTAIDDFSNNNLVRQRGANITLAHRMTPVAALNLIASVDRTSGSEATQATTLRSIRVYWTDQFGPRGDYSLGIRYSSFSSLTNPYTETGVTATLGLRF